ncbi:hypothetical protein ABNQ04_002700 [Shigella flexneri]|nr:hypothetical protein [Shigella flexneri]HAY9074806.1 hypothetical protein [Shigella boydii]EFV9965785.1 hypothetical protein [Shigella flexneri]EFW0114751.1 hypothetical protein [Shigella flexneri]EFW1247655.1 hypothetical protein [Shigella flexneri]
MTMIKDSYQFGIEPVRITDTDNIQVNEGLPTNADPQVYALQLAKTVKAMLNGVLKDAQDNIPFPVEVLPTPIIAHTLSDRSVVVPVRGGERPEVVTVPSGQEIVVEPIEQAILISEQTKLWDAKSSTGFTHGTLQQDAMNICENVVRTINARMVDVLESSKLLKTVELPVLTGSLTTKADAIMDALFENTESSFGSEVSDYGIIAHESQLKALSRLAAKQGFSGEDAIVDMLGTDIAYYNGEDKGVFMLAKRFTALSFGCFRHDGENITVVLSRDGDSQSHDLEILGKVFVVAEAATTVKLDTGAATAVLPVVKRLKFTKTEA